eukprot:m.137923 g.137923  ORF g.137923 m.137923 type:complete len:1784 (-) comp17012_c0_seq1:41-5392(-)
MRWLRRSGMALLAVVAVLFCIAGTSNAQSLSSDDYENKAVPLAAWLDVSWTCHPEERTVSFLLEAQTSGYVGFGISSDPRGRMDGADIVVGWIQNDGTVVATDRHSSSKFPELDSRQDLTNVGGEREGDTVRIAFTRPTSAANGDDVTIGEGNVPVIFAKGSTNALSYHDNNKGAAMVQLCEAQAPETTPEPQEETGAPLTTAPPGTTTPVTTTTMTTTTTTTTTAKPAVLPPLPSAPLLARRSDGSLVIPNIQPRLPGLRARYIQRPAIPEEDVWGIEPYRCTSGCASGKPFAFQGYVRNIDFPLAKDQTLGGPVSGHFAARFEGKIEIPEAGTYKFCHSNSDGARVLVGGKTITYSNDNPHGYRERCGSKTFEKGTLSFRADFYTSGTSAPGFVLMWEGPSFDKQVVAPEAFSYEPRGATQIGLGSTVSRVVDEDDNSCWAPGTNDSPMVYFDLGRVYTVSRVSILARYALANVTVYASNSLIGFGRDPQADWTVCGVAATLPKKSDGAVNVTCAAVGRFLAIGAKDVALQLCDVSIFGTVIPEEQQPSNPFLEPAEADPPVAVPPHNIGDDLEAAGLRKLRLSSGPGLYDGQPTNEMTLTRYNVPRNTMSESDNNDLRWLTEPGFRGSFTVDLGDEYSVAAFTLRNANGNINDQSGGTREWEVSVGTPGYLVNVALGKPASQAGPNSTLASAVVDGSHTLDSCASPGHDDTMGRWWVEVDLGEEHTVDDITLVQGEGKLEGMDMRISNVPMADVSGHDDPALGRPCRTYYFSQTETTGTPPRTNVINRTVTYSCPSVGRYVRVLSYKAFTLCEIEVLVERNGSWQKVDSGVLPPAYGLPTGAMPWYSRTIEPVRARYVKFASLSFYKSWGGLSRFQVWTDEPPRTFMLVNKGHDDATPRPGLQYEEHSGRGSSLYLSTAHLTPAILARERPIHKTIVPTLDFDGVGNSVPWQARQHGTVVLAYGESQTLEVRYEVPFATDPSVSVRLHPRHACCSSDVVVNNATHVNDHSFQFLVDSISEAVWQKVEAEQGERVLTFGWTAVADLPFNTGDWRSARAYGLLRVPRNETYTFFIQADDSAALYIDGDLVVDPGPTKLHGWQPEEPAGSKWLSAGDHEIEVIYVERSGVASLRLMWKDSHHNKVVVPPSALFHKPHPLCLSTRTIYGEARLEECDESNSKHHFLLEGRFVVAAEGPWANALCLARHNNGAFFRNCNAGGFGSFRVGRNEEKHYPVNLFNIVDGLLVSDSTRRLDLSEYPCPDTVLPSNPINVDRYYCEANFQSPKMCVVSDGDYDSIPTFEPCDDVTGDNHAQWEAMPVETPFEPEVVFDGMYEMHENVYVCNSNFRTKTYFDTDEICQRGDVNNTCTFACDDVCDDSQFGGTGSCAEHTDDFDCNPNTRVAVCARKCFEDPDCPSFEIEDGNTRLGRSVCNVHSSDVKWHHFCFTDAITSYIKTVAARDAVATPPSLTPTDGPCENYAEHDLCPVDRCDWRPAEGEPDEAPECRDFNTYPNGGLPFSCSSYVFFGTCDSDDKVGRQCAVTCDTEHFCPGPRHVCAERPSTLPECPTTGTRQTDTYCRCLPGFVCEGSWCNRRSTAGGTGEVATFYSRLCSDCLCKVNETYVAPPPRPTTTTTAAPNNQGSSDGSSSALPMAGAGAAVGLIALVVIAIVVVRARRARESRRFSKAALAPPANLYEENPTMGAVTAGHDYLVDERAFPLAAPHEAQDTQDTAGPRMFAEASFEGSKVLGHALADLGTGHLRLEYPDDSDDDEDRGNIQYGFSA